MSKVRLEKLEDAVTRILETNPITRTDDYLLINAYFDEIVNTDKITFKEVCEQHKELGLPSFEGIRRVRAKVQSKRPDLVDPTTAKRRKRLVIDYANYAIQL